MYKRLLQKQTYLGLMLMMLMVIISCNQSDKPAENKSNKAPTEEELFDINKRLMNEEKTRIKFFVKRNKWPMQSTGTGLQYWIYEQTNGDSIKEREVIKVQYVISLMTGDTCYTRLDKPEEFKVDFDEVESGLHEGVKYMRKGERAKLILPPHLAHGLIGDMNKIPMNATLIYDIKVLED